MEFFNSLNLTQIKGGTKLKQGDLGSVLSYSLTDENGQEITSFDNKTAYINLVLDDKIWFTTTTLVDISRVTFRIDKAIPIGLYYLEIKIDDYIFPSDRDSIILIEEGSTPYDLKELVPNYDVNMTIKGILSDLSQKGIDISNLNRRIGNVNAQLAQKANKDEVTNVMTPKGTLTYASLPTSGNQVGWYYYCPDGDGTHGAGNYVWNGTSWFFGGTGDEGYNLLKKDLENQKISFGSWLFKDENKLKSKVGYITNDLTYVSNDTWQCIFAPIDAIDSKKFVNIYTELDFYKNMIPSLAFYDLNLVLINAKYEKIPQGAYYDIPSDTKYVVMNTTSGAFNTDFNSVTNKIDKASSTLEASNIISKCDGEVITGYGLYTTTEPFYTRETSSVIRYKLEKGKTYTFKNGNTAYKLVDGDPDNVTRFANSNGKSAFTNVFGFEWCYVNNTESSIQIYDRELFQLTNLYENNFTFQRKGTTNGKFSFVNQIVKKGDVITVNVVCKTSSTVGIWLSNESRTSSSIPSKKIEIVNGIGSYVAESDWNGFTIWANDEKTDNPYIVDVCVQNNLKDDVNKVVRVSAYNSSSYDKAKSDYICDGVNDENEINQAIKDVIKNCGTVILCDGDYNIHKFNEYTIAGKKEKIAICVETSSEAKGVTIRGESENKVNSVNIHLSNNAWSGIAEDEIPSIFGGGSKETGYVGGVGFDVKHISIIVDSREHPCIAINMQHAYWGIIDSCSIVVNGFGQDKIPCENLIGIRGFAGWTDGRNVEIKNSYVSGFRVAFQLGGEHLICTQLGARYNYTAYTFGEYPLDSGDVNPAQVHPITLINCCDEHSATLPKFYKSGNASDRGAGRCLVNFIDFNIEYYPLITGTPIVGAMEEFEGGWVGQIDYAIEDDERSNKVGIPFWADGHGSNFKSTNTAQAQLGSTALRNSFAPNYMQQYYDTDLNKIVYCKEPSTKTWIDAMGNIV